MDDLRIGVIGSGGRGGIARHAHRPGDGSRVVACCDIAPRALEQNREWYGEDIATSTDHHELLSHDLDAVFVTSPDFLHEEQAIAALHSGAAVYLEKPMAITVDGCDAVLAAARESGTPLYLGHNMRHFPMVRMMKELIDGGAIGEPRLAWCRHFVSYGGDAYFKDWHAERARSTGLLLQKGAHDIDVIHWLCGGYSRRVSAMGALSVYNRVQDRHPADEPGDSRADRGAWPPLTQRALNPVIEVEDASMMLMELDNGVQASYQQCHYAPDCWRNYTVIGTEGRLENFGDGTNTPFEIRVWNRRDDRYRPEADEVHSQESASGGHGGADPLIVDEFLRYAREGGAIATSPVAARHSVAAACAATESLRDGSRPRDVAPLDPDLATYFRELALA